MVRAALPVEENVTDAVSTIAQRLQWQPLCVVRADGGSGFYAAKWQLPPHRVTSGCILDHILVCHVEGVTSASKTTNGTTVRKHSQAGAVSFIPSGEQAVYTLENQSTFLELYISPEMIRRFCEQHAKTGRCGSIQPLFAIEDPWLGGYFRMLASEIETYGDSARKPDSLLLDQAQQLVLRHLLRAYSDVRLDDHQAERPKGPYALRPHLFRRVTEFIRTNLAADICLTDLAELVHLSEAHFIRSFYGAAGSTPYQYILHERLRGCAELLRAANGLSVAEVAKLMGFKNQSHFATKFKARYGVTPTRYRHNS